MKRIIFLLVIVAQIAVLATMAGQREWISRHGRTVLLRTAPVDPRDPMRGDYVRFNYEIAHVPQLLCTGTVRTWFQTDPRRAETSRSFRDRVVYASVKLDETGIAELTALSDKRPETGLFLRGRVDRINERTLDLRFGVEALFTQQGRAKVFENEAARKAGAPVDVEVAVSSGGTAVLKGYRWEPLGITVEVDRPERQAAGQTTPRQQPRRGIRGVTVELKNHSNAPVAIVVRPAGSSFRLLRTERWEENPFEWVGADKAPAPAAEARMIRVLAPGESFRQHLDFTQPEWFVRDTRKPDEPATSLDQISGTWDTSFRIEYAPPTRAQAIGLPNADAISHSRIRSRAFGPVGID
jgi:uncharacterized membrane-anchored protein